jgi:hypothetical protein
MIGRVIAWPFWGTGPGAALRCVAGFGLMALGAVLILRPEWWVGLKNAPDLPPIDFARTLGYGLWSAGALAVLVAPLSRLDPRLFRGLALGAVAVSALLACAIVTLSVIVPVASFEPTRWTDGSWATGAAFVLFLWPVWHVAARRSVTTARGWRAGCIAAAATGLITASLWQGGNLASPGPALWVAPLVALVVAAWVTVRGLPR